MAQTGHAEILERIAELKKDISGLKTPGQESKNAKDYVTDAELQAKAKEIIKAVEKGPKKEEKAPWEAILEQLKLGPLAGAIKDFGTGQIILLGAMGALTLLIMGLGGTLHAFNRLWLPLSKMREQRNIRLGRSEPDPNGEVGRVWGRNDRGRIATMRPSEALAAPALRVIRSNINTQQLSAHERVIGRLIPQVRKFNEEMARSPKSSEVKKLASAAEKLNTALGKPKLQPDHLRQVWIQVGALDRKTKEVSPAHLNSIASAAGRLSSATGTLTTRFNNLTTAAGRAAAAVGTS
ncbi:hypothetical protein [Streptomyces sp. NPDC047315]|uniref:hypothetical protein n=1 Tax=Streptomyces sp. NPDC047315 TaxID=3155142 RepID=UPI0033F9066E